MLKAEEEKINSRGRGGKGQRTERGPLSEGKTEKWGKGWTEKEGKRDKESRSVKKEVDATTRMR